MKIEDLNKSVSDYLNFCSEAGTVKQHAYYKGYNDPLDGIISYYHPFKVIRPNGKSYPENRTFERRI